MTEKLGFDSWQGKRFTLVRSSSCPRGNGSSSQEVLPSSAEIKPILRRFDAVQKTQRHPKRRNPITHWSSGIRQQRKPQTSSSVFKNAKQGESLCLRLWQKWRHEKMQTFRESRMHNVSVFLKLLSVEEPLPMKTGGGGYKNTVASARR